MNLKLMVCTRCHKQATSLPDCPDQRADLMDLATVHFDKRPPYGGDYTESTIYVTPHERDCRELNRTLHDHGSAK